VYTGLVGTLLGDLAAQVLSHTSKQSQQKQQQQQAQQHTSSSCSSAGFHFDAMRAGRLCLYSAVIGTPMSHIWYGLLESTVLPASPLAPAAVAAKVALDQLLQTPFGMALFFAVMKVLEGKPGQVQPELQSKVRVHNMCACHYETTCSRRRKSCKINRVVPAATDLTNQQHGLEQLNCMPWRPWSGVLQLTVLPCVLLCR
jgi:hypothetical protein